MASPFELAGAARDPSPFAPLHTTRIVTGLYTNRNAMRDASSTDAQEKAYGGRRDAIWDGLNCEISPKLTLRRRPGTSVYNTNNFNRVNRFYSFNTFTLTDEVIHVLADCAEAVYDISNNLKTLVWTKAAGALSTYFLGVGNTLYMTNGAENIQWVYGHGTAFKWGGPAPANAPTATQALRPNPYGSWLPNTGYTILGPRSITILDSFGYWQQMTKVGLTGSTIPNWSPAIGGITTDNQVEWTNREYGSWQASHAYTVGQPVRGAVDPSDPSVTNLFWCIQAGTSGTGTPGFIPGIGSHVSDGGVVWENGGVTQLWAQQVSVTYQNQDTILDPGGYIQKAVQYGRTNSTRPTFATALGDVTQDGTVLWENMGPYAVPGTAPVQYGFAWKNSLTQDLTGMSPKSAPILVQQGNQVTVQGDAPTDTQYDKVVVYSTLQGGAIFGQIAEIPAPSSGLWTYIDTTPGSVQSVNLLLKAQVEGEGTPLPIGATALDYHLGRIFAAVGNVVWVSSGPDAIGSGSSGNAGFDTFFTCQSKITRFWVNSLGIAVFTVRDSYMILGSGTDADPLYMIKWIENIPLLSYDCLALHKTNVIVFTGQRMVLQLDPGAGIVEPSFPIANNVDDFDPSSSFLTFHTERSGENALYLSDGQGAWYRMSPNSAPETGINWSTYAELTPGLLKATNGGPGSASCVQSVEITPGVFRLLFGPGNTGGRIFFRDLTKSADVGIPYPAWAIFGSFTLASPGQLAALAFISLDSANVGTPTKLSVLLGEISGPIYNGGPDYTGTFEQLRRTRQEPPDLPPSTSLISDRFHLLQNQEPVYCRHMQMRIDWVAEDAASELYGFSLYGQLLEEYR